MTTPPPDSPPPRRTSWLRRVALVVLVLLVGAYVFRNALFADLLGRWAGERLSAELGFPVTVARVEGNWFTGVVLVDVEGASEEPGSTLAALRCERLAVGYAPLTVLDDPLAGLRSVDARGLQVRLRAAQGGTTGQTRLRDVLREIPRGVSLRIDGALRIVESSPTDDALAEVGSFSVAGTTDALTLDLRDLASPLLPTREEAGPISIALERTSVSSFTARMTTPLLGATVTAARAGLTPEETWQVGLAGTVAGGFYDLTWEEGPIRGSLLDVDLARLPAWVREEIAQRIEPPASGIVTASGTYRSLERTWTVTAEVAQLDWLGRSLAHVDLEAEQDESGLVVRRVNVTHGEGSLEVLGVVPDEGAPLGVRSVSGFTLLDPDAQLVPRLLADRAPDWLRDAGSVSVFGTLDGRTLTVQRADWSDGGALGQVSGRVDLPAEATPEDLRLGEWAFDLVVTAQADLANLPRLAAQRVDGAALPRAGQLVVKGRVDGTLDAPRFEGRVTAADVEVAGETVNGSFDGTFALPGSLAGGLSLVTSLGEFDATLSVEGAPRTARIRDLRVRALDLQRLAGHSNLDEGIQGTADAEGELAIPIPDALPDDIGAWIATWRGRLRVTSDRAAVRGTRVTAATADIASADGDWAATDVRLAGDGFAITTAGRWSPVENRLRLEDVTASFDDPGASLATWTDLAEEVRSPVRLEGALDVPLDDPLRATGRISGTVAMLDLPSARVDDLAFGVDLGATTWTVERLSARALLDLERGPHVEEIALEEPARITFRDATTRDDATVRMDALSVAGGRVALDGRIGSTVELTVTARDLDVGRAGLDGLVGRLDLDVRAAGRLEALASWSVHAVGRELRYRDQDALLELTARQTDDGVLFERCALDLGDAGRLEVGGVAPWRIDLDGLHATGTPSAGYHASFTTAHPESWLARFLGPLPPSLEAGKLTARVSSARGRFTADASWTGLAWKGRGGTRLAVEQPVRLTVDGTEARARIALTGGAPIALDGALDVLGDLDWRRPWTLPEAVSDARLDGRLQLAIDDLAPFAIVSPALVFAGGKLEGRATVAGTGAAPTVRGELTGADLTARVEGDIPVLDQGVLRIGFDPAGVDVTQCTARLGYAPVSLSGSLRRGDGGAWTSALALRGERTLLARSEYVRLRADLDIDVQGPLDALRITGDARVTDALFTRPMDLLGGGGAPARDFELFSLRDPPLAAARFDVRVQADRTIRIQNNRARGSLSADVRILGTGAAPFPRGRVTLDEGTLITLPFSRLTTQRGVMIFPEVNPYDPQLELSATSRMKGYDLAVDVSGRASAARVDVSTLPALPPEQALLLLSTGSTPEELERDGLSTAAVTKAGTLIGARIVNWFTGPGDPDADSLLDRVTLEIGRDVSRSGAETVDAEFELTERWFLRAERDRYDAYNGGLVWRIRFR